MKKIEVETECGEVSVIYVSQDIKRITVDGKVYGVQEDNRLPLSKDDVNFKALLKELNDRTNSFNDRRGATGENWVVDYDLEGDHLTIDFCGSALPNAIFRGD